MRRRALTNAQVVFATVAVLVTAYQAGLAARQDKAESARQDKAEFLKANPPSLDSPTEVTIDVSGIQLLGVDPQNQTFQVEGFIDASWYDERLAFDSPSGSPKWKLYQDEAATEKLKIIWWPFFEISDSRGPRTTIHRTVQIDYDGEVFYQERFAATIVQDFALRLFPFDSTPISFRIEPFAEGGNTVNFIAAKPPGDATDNDQVDEQMQTRVPGFKPPEWENATILPLKIESGENAWPSVTASIMVTRDPSSYVINIMLPLALIVVVASAVFWMDLGSTHLGDRLGISFTALLTVVAFDFVTSDSLPKLWYLTIMERIVIATYVVMAMVIVQNVAACVIHVRGKQTLALAVDRVSRVAFPVGYLVYVWTLIPEPIAVFRAMIAGVS